MLSHTPEGTTARAEPHGLAECFSWLLSMPKGLVKYSLKPQMSWGMEHVFPTETGGPPDPGV